MKIIHKNSCLIAYYLIMCCLWSCKPVENEQKEVTVDVIITSNFDSSTLPVELQKLFMPEVLPPDNNNLITMWVPTGKLSRADMTTPLEFVVKYEKTQLMKMQEQLKKTDAEDIRKNIKDYLSAVDVSSLNSKEQTDAEEKNNRLKDFILKKQDENAQNLDVLFYSENLQCASWDNYPVYHDIDNIREIIFKSISSQPKNKFLIVFNPGEDINAFPDSIILDKTTLEFNNVGESEQLNVVIYPEDLPEKSRKVIWKSGDEKIAKIDENGLVTAVDYGNVLIWVETVNELAATCYVSIAPAAIEVTQITLETTNVSLKKGDTIRLKETILPENATNKEIKWLSDNPTVAKVDSTTGVVTAVAEKGTANITVTTTDGGKTATCAVTVKVPERKPPSITQLNSLLTRIANSDDNATDEIRKVLGNSLQVEGATNINNVQQLITDVSNGSRYNVTKVNTNTEGIVVSISVSKE